MRIPIWIIIIWFPQPRSDFFWRKRTNWYWQISDLHHPCLMTISKANAWQLIFFNFVNPYFLIDIFNVKYFLIFNL